MDAALLDMRLGATDGDPEDQAPTRNRVLQGWAGTASRRRDKGSGREQGGSVPKAWHQHGSQLPSSGPGEMTAAACHTLVHVCLCLQTLGVHRGRKRLTEIPDPEWKKKRSKPSGPGMIPMRAGGQSRVLCGKGGLSCTLVSHWPKQKGKYGQSWGRCQLIGLHWVSSSGQRGGGEEEDNELQ